MHPTPNPEPAQLSSRLRRSPVCEAKTATEWTDPILASRLCVFILGHRSAARSWQEGAGKILEWDLSSVFTLWLYLPKMSDLFGIISHPSRYPTASYSSHRLSAPI